jgi:hypothetical protein
VDLVFLALGSTAGASFPAANSVYANVSAVILAVRAVMLAVSDRLFSMSGVSVVCSVVAAVARLSR